MQDRQVENNQRQLKGHTKGDLEQHHDIEIVFSVGQHRRKVGRLLDEPAKGRLLYHEIAKNHPKEEEDDHRRHRRDDPPALVALKRRKNETHDLPYDDRRADNHTEKKRHLEADCKAAKRCDDGKLRARGQCVPNCIHHDVDQGWRCKVDDHGCNQH